MKEKRVHIILILVLAVCFLAAGILPLFAQETVSDSPTEGALPETILYRTDVEEAVGLPDEGNPPEGSQGADEEEEMKEKSDDPASIDEMPDEADPKDEENPPVISQNALRILVPFDGWDNGESMEIASLTVEELEQWPLYEQDYTVYDPERGIFVDHALGISLRDLIDELKIDERDVRDFRFICEKDSEAAVKEIPAKELLYEARYFYGDLPGYGDPSAITEEDDVSVMKQEAETLLAFQDHWMTEEEYLDPETDVEDMTDEYAFRLIPGQRSVTDCTTDLVVSRITGIEILLEKTPSVHVTPAEINGEPGTTVPVGVSVDTCGYRFLEDLEILWRSDDESAVTVDSSGMVSIRSREPSSITMMAGGMTIRIPVNQTLLPEKEPLPVSGEEKADPIENSGEETGQAGANETTDPKDDISPEPKETTKSAKETQKEKSRNNLRNSNNTDVSPSDSKDSLKQTAQEILTADTDISTGKETEKDSNIDTATSLEKKSDSLNEPIPQPESISNTQNKKQIHTETSATSEVHNRREEHTVQTAPIVPDSRIKAEQMELSPGENSIAPSPAWNISIGSDVSATNTPRVQEIIPSSTVAVQAVPESKQSRNNADVSSNSSNSAIEKRTAGNRQPAENPADDISTGAERGNRTDVSDTEDHSPDSTDDIFSEKYKVYEITLGPPVSPQQEAFPSSTSAVKTGQPDMFPDRKTTRIVLAAALLIFLLGMAFPLADRTLGEYLKNRQKTVLEPAMGAIL